MNRDMCALVDKLHAGIASADWGGYFVMAIVDDSSVRLPAGVEVFIRDKYRVVSGGGRARKFVFRAEGCKVTVVFFRRDDPFRYNMTNFAMFRAVR